MSLICASWTKLHNTPTIFSKGWILTSSVEAPKVLPWSSFSRITLLHGAYCQSSISNALFNAGSAFERSALLLLAWLHLLSSVTTEILLTQVLASGTSSLLWFDRAVGCNDCNDWSLVCPTLLTISDKPYTVWSLWLETQLPRWHNQELQLQCSQGVFFSAHHHVQDGQSWIDYSLSWFFLNCLHLCFLSTSSTIIIAHQTGIENVSFCVCSIITFPPI